MGIQFTWSHKRRARKGERPWCSVVVPAAGSATRMEGTDKIMAELGDKPVIAHTLLALQQCPYVDEIVVVTREDLIPEIGWLAQQWECDKVTRIVRGGETRMESVWNGLNSVDPRANLIGIHDGARPLVSQTVLADVFVMAAATGAAAPAVPVKDTIKSVDEHETVQETVPRDALRAVQTPQAFDAAIIKAATQRAREQELTLTDDCAAVEALGMKVTLTKGAYENLKITTPIDLALGEAIVQCQPV